MDRSMHLRHLAQVERHIELGEQHIVEQEERVAIRELYGRDATASQILLDTFRALQAHHIAHRERILAELRG